jgi:hypothetical protein
MVPLPVVNAFARISAYALVFGLMIVLAFRVRGWPQRLARSHQA